MKILCLFVGLIGAAIIASLPPDFSNDSQYYVQSGIVWARGDVTYAGSLVGSRILAILYYHWPLVVFGPSIDAISLALGIAFLAYALLVTAWCFKEIASSGIATLIALAVIVTGFVWLPWQSPLTEQVAVVLILAVLYLLALRRKATGRARWLLLIVAATLSGIGIGVRSELAILPVLIVIALLIDFSKPIRERASIAATVAIAFVIAAQVPPLTFRAFTGRPTPPQMTNYFLFYQALHAFGDANNGPSSAELAALGSKVRVTLGQPVQTSDVNLGIGPAFALYGGQEANRLARDAGIETLRAKPRHILYLGRKALFNYLFFEPIIDKDQRTYEDRWRDASNRIKAIDGFRAEASPRFGDDARFPVASLFENRLGFVSATLGGLPLISVVPPASLITLIALIALFLAVRRRDFSAPAPIAAAYFFSCVMLASFSQGYVVRYFMVASLPLVVVFTIEVGKRLYELKNPLAKPAAITRNRSPY